MLSLCQEGSRQLPNGPVGVGGVLGGPSPESPPGVTLLRPAPTLSGTWPRSAQPGFCPACPPTESRLGPGPDDLMHVCLSESAREASPPTNIMLRVELAGRDAATRRVSSWLVNDNHGRVDVGRISVLPSYFEIIPYVMPKCLSTLMAF